jgi:hypothetical protein
VREDFKNKEGEEPASAIDENIASCVGALIESHLKEYEQERQQKKNEKKRSERGKKESYVRNERVEGGCGTSDMKRNIKQIGKIGKD